MTRLALVGGLLVLQVAGAGLVVPGAALAPQEAARAVAEHGVSTLALPGAACTPETTVYSPEVPVALEQLNSTLAWTVATGRGVTVAVVDSGVAAGNAHLAGVVLPGISLIDVPEPDDAPTTDVMAHGTAVAGQIAARPVAGSGVVGLARDAVILPVRVYLSTDEQAVEAGNGPRDDRMAAGIRAAADAGAQIINVSMSTTVDSTALRRAVEHAASLGSLVVASAGNRNTTQDTQDSPRYPAAYPDVLAVTSVDSDGLATQDAIHGPHIDVAAPGTDILTTYLAAGDCLLGDGVPSTSYATAYVSAAAALLAEAYPTESPAQWAYRLEVTAARSTLDVKDAATGWGTIRPSEALAFVDDGTARGPESPVFVRHDRTVPTAQVLDLGREDDPIVRTQGVAAWWALAGAGALLATVLLGRLVGHARTARR
ncbi:S8 family serine peptidase [Sanguibacter antarcticus]|uniref:Subtilase family protein n=1 Tax=Sanguibacter antarcticus TaxID=372484 RepID=A0A2A9E3L9_9MICO|nr:S8 family serine peptidase [Sanguibacter antarcticus]PFG32799.1 subtilase family protein [Sanguibacter antarcticus]